nr:Glucose-1-phosphate adenylyltransferase [Candidatus Anoxychlamydiales bacterium]
MQFESTRKHYNIASIILAGGKGTRLHPLTLNHSKPAVPFGGRYRLIDIPISNSLNSNIRQIIVIGQYLTTELGHHLSQTYQF